MPVVSEDRFILGRPGILRDALLASGAAPSLLDQAHLGTQLRYERIRPFPEGRSSDRVVAAHRLGEDILEHDAPVSAADFDLADAAAVARLSLLRLRLPGGGEVRWRVDFLLDGPAQAGGRCYLCMARSRRPPGPRADLPPALAAHRILTVAPEDADAFADMLLADRRYATALLGAAGPEGSA